MRSGQVTVITAGTAVQGGNIPLGGVIGLVAHPDNTDVVYFGNDGAGDVSSSTGVALSVNGPALLARTANLNQIWFDAATDGDIICWYTIEE